MQNHHFDSTADVSVTWHLGSSTRSFGRAVALLLENTFDRQQTCNRPLLAFELGASSRLSLKDDLEPAVEPQNKCKHQSSSTNAQSKTELENRISFDADLRRGTPLHNLLQKLFVQLRLDVDPQCRQS